MEDIKAVFRHLPVIKGNNRIPKGVTIFIPSYLRREKDIEIEVNFYFYLDEKVEVKHEGRISLDNRKTGVLGRKDRIWKSPVKAIIPLLDNLPISVCQAILAT